MGVVLLFKFNVLLWYYHNSIYMSKYILIFFRFLQQIPISNAYFIRKLFSSSSNLVSPGRRTCGVFVLWAAFPRGLAEKCLNCYWVETCGSSLPLERHKESPLHTQENNFIMVVIVSKSLTHYSDSICGGLFLKYKCMSFFYSFHSFCTPSAE